jgi:hypothetical protein
VKNVVKIRFEKTAEAYFMPIVRLFHWRSTSWGHRNFEHRADNHFHWNHSSVNSSNCSNTFDAIVFDFQRNPNSLNTRKFNKEQQKGASLDTSHSQIYISDEPSTQLRHLLKYREKPQPKSWFLEHCSLTAANSEPDLYYKVTLKLLNGSVDSRL